MRQASIRIKKIPATDINDTQICANFFCFQDEMEVNGSSDASAMRSVCARAGCNNPAIESDDWDKEYCSNECVATHCRCVQV